MRVFDLKNGGTLSSPPKGCTAVFGFFDGVHRAHSALIRAALDGAKSRPSPLLVWSFDSLPKATELITTVPERLSLLASLGADYAVLEDYDAVRFLTPSAFFAEYLMPGFAPCAVFAGYDFRYGVGATGTVDNLMKSAEEYGVPCSVLPPFTVDGKPVSSSEIRSLLRAGEVGRAAYLLGRPYEIRSTVVSGKRIGRTLGFATVNLRLPDGKIEPSHGVYAATVILDGVRYQGVTNIGSRPTVNGDATDVTVETHLFDYNGDCYGKEIRVLLVERIRGEIKFDSLGDLKAQIAEDSALARLIPLYSPEN